MDKFEEFLPTVWDNFRDMELGSRFDYKWNEYFFIRMDKDEVICIDIDEMNECLSDRSNIPHERLEFSDIAIDAFEDHCDLNNNL